MADPISQFYADNPWVLLDKNQRTWYDPELVGLYRAKAVFSPTVRFVKNLNGVRATEMVVTSLIEPHPDYNPIDLRAMWLPAAHIDSREVHIRFQRYGGKVAYHKYDDMVTYWERNQRAGLRAIINQALGQHMIDVMDLLARNAYIAGALTTGFVLYAGSATDFGSLTSNDKFDIDVAMDIWLGMANRGVAAALGPNGAQDSIVCFTSPGVIYDIQQSPEWISVHMYQGIDRILPYEVGAYKNVRFVQTPKCTLWNAGSIIFRAPIVVAAPAHSGASAQPVDGVYYTGQANATHYIQLDTPSVGAFTDIKPNDIVAIHVSTTNDFGVTGGVDFRDGATVYRRVVSVDASNKRISLDKPLMVDFTTDLGGGVYGYVTKARHVHASIFVGGGDAIVAGAAQPPRFYTPGPIDDFESMYRFTWDAYMGYQPYNPDVFEVVFSSATFRYKGSAEVA